MIEWEETDSGLRVFDRTKTEVWIEAEDWQPSETVHDIDRPVDEALSRRASEIRLPAGLVTASSLTTGDEFKHGGETESVELPADEYLLTIDLNIKTYLRFSGAATVRKTADFNELHISFGAETDATFGFRSSHERPVDTITVPPTPEGLATAVTYLSSSHKTSGPMRSYPTLRGHPPRIDLGERTAVPERVREQRFDVGIELLVPNSFEYTFVAAPLAYYLQAEMRVTDRDAPVLRARSVGVEREFGTLPEFQHEAAATLRRVFFLDCLVRNAGDYSWELAELDLLDEIGIDPEATYESTRAEQLATYLDAPYGSIDEELPEWHLAMHVEPVADNMTCLPYFLDSLSLLYLPESNDLEKNKLLNKSIDDFYRAEPPERPRRTDPDSAARSDPGPVEPVARSGPGPVESVDRCDPVLHEGRVNGWLADGVPIDVFNAVPEAYENRFKYLDRSDGDIDVTVILNDEEMSDEHEDAADIYRERSKTLPIDVTVREYLTEAELTEVLESHHEFVHYIGHCEEDGLRCADGHLSVSDIDESNVQTFFLNACGSYYEGRDLVEKGSVAGAVTFTKVLNKQAAKVGVAFARLLINGFNIELALQYARRRIMMGKDYSVVGDGSHVLTQTANGFPSVMTVEETAGEYRIQMEQIPVKNNGIVFDLYLDEVTELHLQGTEVTFTLEQAALQSFLHRAKMPVIYDGEIYWSDEMLKLLD